MNVQNGNVLNANRWDLAKRLSKNENETEHIIRNLFKDVIAKIEENLKEKFSLSLKHNVWNSVYKDRVVALKLKVINEVYDNILGLLDDETVDKMLEEHKSAGLISTADYVSYLGRAFIDFQPEITRILEQEVNSIKLEFISEITNAVKNEGVLLNGL